MPFIHHFPTDLAHQNSTLSTNWCSLLIETLALGLLTVACTGFGPLPDSVGPANFCCIRRSHLVSTLATYLPSVSIASTVPVLLCSQKPRRASFLYSTSTASPAVTLLFLEWWSHPNSSSSSVQYSLVSNYQEYDSQKPILSSPVAGFSVCKQVWCSS
ncbi:hypothetical protein BC834DRAFT_396796 [Gloeopeniophorella convolvens]|nr:hypothetical protein BC834DRAFT_396796 [Gloeopeniophorella convolvens]